MYVESTVRDPSVADELAPLDETDQNQPYDQLASLSWGTLMAGQQIVLPESVNLIGYTQSLLSMLDRSMKIDQGSGVLPSRDKVVGYVNTMQFVESLAVQIAQDQQQMELVKFIETALTNGATLLKQWIDALSKQAGQGLSQEEQAKADSVVQQAQTKMAIEAADAEQKRRHSEISFQQQLQRNRETLQHELEATDMRAAADVATKRMKADEQAKP